MREISILYGNAAVFIPSHKTLVIADLHIGIEYEFYERGIHIGSRGKLLIEKTKRLVEETGADRLIILGDVKHVIPSTPFSQKRDIIGFFESLRDLVDIGIVPGNHDGGLKKIVPYVDIKPSSGYVIRDTGLIHGHRWPSKEVMECSTILSAHTHPTVSLKDGFGYEFFERCWVFSGVDRKKVLGVELLGKDKKLSREKKTSRKKECFIIMPAFNPMCGGVSVNREGIIGPLSKLINLEESEIYLLDGSALGKVRNLK